MSNLDDLEENHDEWMRRNGVCISCARPFTDENVFTVDGWREVNISQMCEKCFDECIKEEEELKKKSLKRFLKKHFKWATMLQMSLEVQS